MIRLRVFARLREIAGAKEVAVDGDQASVQKALERFADRFGAEAKEALFDGSGEVRAGVMLLVNNASPSQGPATIVTAQDVITVLLPTSGG